MEGGPEAVAGAAEVAADGGGVEAGVDAGEEDDEVFGDEIRDELVVRGEELGFGGFPGSGQSLSPICSTSSNTLRCSRHDHSLCFGCHDTLVSSDSGVCSQDRDASRVGSDRDFLTVRERGWVVPDHKIGVVAILPFGGHALVDAVPRLAQDQCHTD